MKEKYQLQEGDVFKIKEGMSFYATVPEHFLYTNKKGCFDNLAHGIIQAAGEFDYYIGDYVVYKTTRDSGSSTLSDQWHVFAEKLTNRNIKIDFFNEAWGVLGVLNDIEIIGKAVAIWDYTIKNGNR